MRGCIRSKTTISTWSKLEIGFFKFNVDGAARGKPGLIGIGGVVCDDSVISVLRTYGGHGVKRGGLASN